ncbi:MAG: T9SS type A sorting domain-containing protein [Bacteroidales bacterium]|nr:T9SS type A sorting domain-containing protein [Bacteroidales bacterium]
MKMKIFTIAFGMLLFGAALSAQDTIFYYGWEEGTEPGPIGSLWVNTGQTWVHGTATGDTADARTGNSCFWADVYADAAQNWDNQAVPEGIEVEDSSAYRYTIWAKVDGGEIPTINITCGRYVDWAELSRKGMVLITPEWERYYLQVYVKDASELPLHQVVEGEDTIDYPNHIRFPLHFFRIGTYRLDDVSVIKSTIAYIMAAGNTVTVNFGWALEWSDDISADAFTVTVNGTPVTVNEAVMRDLGDLVEPWIDLTVDADIAEGDVVLVSYDGTAELYYSGNGPITDEMGHAAVFTDEVAEFGVQESPVGIKDAVNRNVSIAFDGESIRILDMLDIDNVRIYSVGGQLLKQIDKATEVISITDLNRGAYIIRIQSGDGIYTAKFIK